VSKKAIQIVTSALIVVAIFCLYQFGVVRMPTDANDFFDKLISGICIGAIYALIALGYTMVYGIIKLINFAHGEFYMFGAYIGLATYNFIPESVPIYLSIPVVLLFSGIAGAVIAVLAEFIAYRPIRKADRLIALLTAIGVSFFLQNSFKFVNSGKPLFFSGKIEEITSHTFMLGDITIQTIKLSWIVVSIVLMLFLWYITMKTRLGRAMRATSQDLDAARLMGINVNLVITCTFAIGGFFAGIAGVMMGAKNTVEPFMGFMPGLYAFVAAVVGGIGSIPGAVIGGFLIGILQLMVVWYGIDTAYMNVATFVVLIIVLVFKPEGILGKNIREKV
jgi:branched-chain amino acid transport system permease protein